MTGRLFLCYLLFLINAIPLVSQKETLLQANHAFEMGHYQKAIRLYTQYNKINRDSEALGKRGIANFNYNLVEKAIEDFTAAKKQGNNDPLLYLKMGQSKQFLRSFDEASFFYQKYLDLTDDKAPYRKMAELEIKNCVFSALESFETSGTLIQSFGENVNSRYDEIYPIQSPTFGNVFYFSSNRNKSNFDILSYTLSEDGLWSKNDMSDKPFNNGYHNVALDVDGATINAMLYSEVDMNGEKIQFASFDLSGQDIVVQLPPEIFEGAKDLSIVNHNMLVFASKKLKGFGGYDIFTVSYKDGSWSTPLNLGAAINSPFDEICPFYSNNLDHFYFSSNRPYCFGGYDIYYCDISNEKLPVNMGYGINSHGDDLHFNIDDAGHMATYSSNRKTGLGGYDLYFAYLQDVKNMGIRDSLVYEYLVNPSEEFVQVKNQDAITSLETNRNNLNSSSEATAIEISTKIEAIKEKTTEEEEEKVDNPVLGTSNTSDIVTDTSKEVTDKLNTTSNRLEKKTTDTIGKNDILKDEKNSSTKSTETEVANNLPTQIKTDPNVEVETETPSISESTINDNKDVKDVKNDIAENDSVDENKIDTKEKNENHQESTSIKNEALDSNNSSSHLKNDTNDLESNINTTPNSENTLDISTNTDSEGNKIDITDSNSENNSSINNSEESSINKTVENKDLNDKVIEDGVVKNEKSESDNKNNSTDKNATETSKKEVDEPVTIEDLEDDQIDTNDLIDNRNPSEILPKTKELKATKLEGEKQSGINKERDFKQIEKSWTTFVQPQTLYYQDRQDLTRGENLVKLNQLIVSEYETISTFVLLAHTDDSELGLPEYVQYNTLKRALKIAEYLNESGISSDRIKIESLANNYPLIKTDIAGEKINSLYAYNKRVDILISEEDRIKEDNVIADSSIPNYAFDRKYELFRSIREGTYFSIEIASSKRIFKNAILRLYNDIYIRRDDLDGENKYYIGIYTQKEDAETVRTQLLETSSPYARVVKFVNGKPTK